MHPAAAVTLECRSNFFLDMLLASKLLGSRSRVSVQHRGRRSSGSHRRSAGTRRTTSDECLVANSLATKQLGRLLKLFQIAFKAQRWSQGAGLMTLVNSAPLAVSLETRVPFTKPAAIPPVACAIRIALWMSSLARQRSKEPYDAPICKARMPWWDAPWPGWRLPHRLPGRLQRWPAGYPTGRGR